MTERHIFEHESGMGLEAGKQAAEQQQKDFDHDEAKLWPMKGKIQQSRRPTEFSLPKEAAAKGTACACGNWNYNAWPTSWVLLSRCSISPHEPTSVTHLN